MPRRIVSEQSCSRRASPLSTQRTEQPTPRHKTYTKSITRRYITDIFGYNYIGCGGCLVCRGDIISGLCGMISKIITVATSELLSIGGGRRKRLRRFRKYGALRRPCCRHKTARLHRIRWLLLCADRTDRKRRDRR